MKNLRQLGFILGAGTIAAFSLTGCGDETTPPGGTAGTSSGGTAAGGSGTSGSGTGGTSASGSSSGGGGTGGAAAGSSSGGGGTGGASGGGGAGGASGGGGAGGSGGATGGGGAGGSGGATGGGGAGGAGGGGAGGPSADCAKWCQGADSVLTICAQNNIPEKINSEQKCLSVCAASPGASVTCWNTHTNNAKTMDKGVHCPHATGADSQNVCPKLP